MLDGRHTRQPVDCPTADLGRLRVKGGLLKTLRRRQTSSPLYLDPIERLDGLVAIFGRAHLKRCAVAGHEKKKGDVVNGRATSMSSIFDRGGGKMSMQFP